MIDQAPATGALAVLTMALTVLATGCATGNPTFQEPVPAASAEGQTQHPAFAAFEPGALADYQLATAYEPVEGVAVVVRDASEEPLDGAYSICYINGFQSQPGEEWPPGLVLSDSSGDPLVDPNWPDESILDISTAANRSAIAARLSEIVLGCAEKGFDAVEFDNLDSFLRSEGQLTRDQTIKMAELLTSAGHDAGLAVAQKNAAELLGESSARIGFDFAIVEECAQFSECADFTAVYGAAVIDVEYSDDMRRSFDEVCADPTTPDTTILRDRDLTAPGSGDYVFDHCQ